MTTYSYNSADGKLTLTIEGHAVGDDDRICSAISSIAFALMGFVLNEDRSGKPVIEYRDGECRVSAIKTDRTSGAFDMAYVGLKQIEKQYPDYIKEHI